MAFCLAVLGIDPGEGSVSRAAEPGVERYQDPLRSVACIIRPQIFRA
ncbi:hypothetical protein [Marinobacter sp. ATCH36]|nr:hypothetical protein [Marinobacter sp. ATCH36]MCL7945583.1 hypothetical protein [Marinobacter sp. ATCH36]